MILTLITQLLKNMHEGTIYIKFTSTAILSVLFTPIALLFEASSEWLGANIDYIGLVLGAIAIDHLLGSLVHFFIKKDWSFKENIIGLCKKILLVVAVGFLFEGIGLISEQSFFEEYLKIVTRLMVFLYPAGSAFVNSSILTDGKFPPTAWLEKIADFSKDLKIKR